MKFKFGECNTLHDNDIQWLLLTMQLVAILSQRNIMFILHNTSCKCNQKDIMCSGKNILVPLKWIRGLLNTTCKINILNCILSNPLNLLWLHPLCMHLHDRVGTLTIVYCIDICIIFLLRCQRIFHVALDCFFVYYIVNSHNGAEMSLKFEMNLPH